jgi:hypothetical protein
MLKGRDIVDLAKEIKRRSEAKADYLVTASAIQMTNGAEFDFSADSRLMPGTPHAHRQLAEYVDIPARYYNRLLAEDKPLLATNVNKWLNQKPDERRMVRTLDNSVRALLSDRYRRLDNEEVAEAALPMLLGKPHIQLVSCDITETKLYLKAVFPKTTAEVKKGDIVQAGVAISNSEIGCGALTVEPLVYRLACLNGMIFADTAFRKMHIGARIVGEDSRLFRDATKQADDKALLMAMQDMIAAASETTFNALVNRMRDAAGSPAVKEPVPAVERLGKSFGLLTSEQDSVLEQLILGKDYTLWGMANAVTAAANGIADYDRSTELQALGSRVLTLERSEWQKIREAA